jgi:hypothetical protein
MSTQSYLDVSPGRVLTGAPVARSPSHELLHKCVNAKKPLKSLSPSNKLPRNSVLTAT